MTYDQSHDGGDNGRGGRFNDSTEGILKRQALQREAETKAASAPDTLTVADLDLLPGETTSRLMASGALTHLGLGGRRHPPRRHR
jgi:hypothetical protein